LGNTCTEGQIDGIAGAVEHGCHERSHCSLTPGEARESFTRCACRRRAARTTARNSKRRAKTLVVSGHGGLLLLKHEVADGEMLVITNPETQEEQECRVVYLGDLGDKGQRVGVEFLTPAPRFWGVEFVETPPAEDSSAVH